MLPALFTVAFLPLKNHVAFANIAMTFLLIVVVTAVVGGLLPALAAVVLSAALLNFFFTEPFHTPFIADAENIMTLTVMVAAAVLVAIVVNRSAVRAAEAERARREAALLFSFARIILFDDNPADRLLARITEDFELESAALEEFDGTHWHTTDHARCQPSKPVEVKIQVVQVSPDVRLVVAGNELARDDWAVLETAGFQAVLALRHQRMSATAAEAERQADAAALRNALLSALGHDLRTPLTSLKTAIGSLQDEQLRFSPEDRRELLSVADESAAQLSGLVDNLLDSSRLVTGAVRPNLGNLAVEDAIARALRHVTESDSISLDIADNLPEILADGGLLERVIANLADNALRHGGKGVTITVRAISDDVVISVADHGPGLPLGPRDETFAPFRRRGDRNMTTGIGLGMSVAKGFTEAMAGTIEVAETPGGGLTVNCAFPAVEYAGAGEG
ncbi:Osmosensitive K channel His kinase sensor [Hoyosella subflava DQS3-9A1]|uniref:histidine kinase n=1 Tax=Hoyosella subflava (strain DSM 45089 / JCM 17490 / NBRC 109087 / DQS3-9A1) TaxID=443218 RepID=F6EL20_HOYSD|nr:Osmosensitive K channel His kinase sensor [Hoyosella subflava DQS3-9A1]